MPTYCCILPPYLLRAVVENYSGEAAARAEHTLRLEATMRAQREVRAARVGRLDAPPGGAGSPTSSASGIIPTDLLERLGHEEDRTMRADLDEATRRRTKKPRKAPTTPPAPAAVPTPHRTVCDAQQGSALPGRPVRAEGARPVADESANEAYDGLGATWRLFHEVYGRDSLDDHGLPLLASVHYQRGYDNAFWNGDQMVFGDGDGVVFRSFTDCVDVIGHELTHGLTQYTANLVYLAQAGALNESLSDVFGVLTEQYQKGQTADAATWLIGAGLFTPSVKGVALRSMKAPGTAYDDPRLGKDPQPATMSGYRDMPHDDSGDNGGVHVNSGIPNHAFYLFATALQGHAWERAGQVWYDTLVAGKLPKDADFARFAGTTVAMATRRYGAGDVVDALAAAWRQVEVTPAPQH